MPATLIMPKLSPTMEEGTIVKWHKKEGDPIAVGDVLIEVATDKATVEYEALDKGWLRKILIPEGKVATVNQAIAIYTEDKKESIEGYKPEGITPTVEKKAEEKAAAPVPQEEVVPQFQRTEPPTFKQPQFVPEAPLKEYAFEYPTEKLEKRIPASPLAKKLAKEKGLDLSTVKGTGPQQRIMSRDLAKAQATGVVNFGHRERPTEIPGSYEEIALTPMRKIVGQRLQESKSYIPHFYVEYTIDAEPLVALREQLKQGDVKVSVNDFIVRAVALGLRRHPLINRGFNSSTQSIIQFKTIDIAVAVKLGEGLITPIVRHADYKNLGEISVEVKALAARAKEGKLEPHEYKGGSFTISNLGMYGVTNFQAIINPPQAAILAVSGIQDVPVVKKGSVVPGKTMSLTLSVDHRVVDGVDGAEFLITLKHYLENPALLLL